MEEKKENRNFFVRLFRLLVETRWFFTMTASGTATIIGISLTFGINSCRESHRVKREAEKSMMQAIENLDERFDDAHAWMDIINNQTRVFRITDSINRCGGEIPDSLCDEFRNTMPFIKISAFDHEFEKIFRGSYQLWQLHNNNDSLAFYIGECYDALNTVESSCQRLSESMLEQIGICNATQPFYRLDNRQWTVALLNHPQFQYYMAVRGVKAAIASGILQEAKRDYNAHVVDRHEED